MGTVERRARQKEELRSKILDAARSLFVREGFEAVSMRKIAEAIEYSPTAIYTLFKDKEALMQELCSSDFCHLAVAFSRLGSIEDPIERIKQYGREYIRFAVAHPNHYRLTFMTTHQAPSVEQDAGDVQGNPDRDGYAMLKTAVQEALKRKRFKPELEDAELLSQILWAGVHGVASLEITHGKDPWIAWAPLDQRIDLMVDGLMDGLLAKERA